MEKYYCHSKPSVTFNLLRYSNARWDASSVWTVLLRDRAHRREVYSFSSHPTFNNMFSNAVSGYGTLFSQAIISE